MSTMEAAGPAVRRASAPMVLAAFTGAIFLSAFLLFAIQPMFARMILPRLGGSPAVWSVALVFFQAVLLAGYAYAHGLTHWVGVRRATIVHLALLTAAVFAMPIAVAGGWNRPPETGQAFWLLGLLTASVGLPFFAVAGNGPLLQAWFARTGHPHARDPYFLYAASNVGSFAALLLYPFLFAPALTLREQSALWTVGFLGLVGAIGTVAVLTLRATARGTTVDGPAAAPTVRPTTGAVLAWIGLAFVPSALLVAVTAHISTDIVAIPFLWILPLALYLLTFVIAFQRRPLLPHRAALFVVPLLIAPLAVSVTGFGPAQHLYAGLALHLGFFFFAALACHGELARRRPDAAYLTGFYLAIAFGGVLGGIFSGLLAPAIFSSVIEYPILMVATLVCLPALWAIAPRSIIRNLAIAAVAVAVLIAPAQFELVPSDAYWFLSMAIVVGGVAAIVLARRSPALHLGIVAAVILLADAYRPVVGETETRRSFFGVHKIAETLDGEFRLLLHGTTLHGAERIRNEDGSKPSGRPEPTTYYADDGALADGISAIREARGALHMVAVVGLGTGSIACQREPGEQFRFYEIDQEVADIARDVSEFTFLERCAPDASVVIGDARLTLTEAKPGTFDLIVLDAFSSDAVPVHLLTREAIAEYFRVLAPGGVLLFHISNRYMDLSRVVAGSAAANGLVTRIGQSDPDAEEREDYELGTLVAAVAREADDLGRLAEDGGIWHAAHDQTRRTWTDDYSNVIGAILRGPPSGG